MQWKQRIAATLPKKFCNSKENTPGKEVNRCCQTRTGWKRRILKVMPPTTSACRVETNLSRNGQCLFLCPWRRSIRARCYKPHLMKAGHNASLLSNLSAVDALLPNIEIIRLLHLDLHFRHQSIAVSSSRRAHSYLKKQCAVNHPDGWRSRFDR